MAKGGQLPGESGDVADWSIGDQATTGDIAFEMRGISKRFGHVAANASVDFTVRLGEIRALVGENGAGKTTLMRVLYGLTAPDDGEIRIGGVAVGITDSRHAIELGIGMVHQHFNLVPNLTGLENVVLGAPTRRRGRLHLAPALEQARAELLEISLRYGLEVPLLRPTWQLSVGEQQRLEIIRALYQDARILILDEPTANLTPHEARALMAQLRSLAHQGKAVVVITHHLDEVVDFADRATVMRQGRVVGTLEAGEVDADVLAQMMVGREVTFPGAIAAADRQADTEVAPTVGRTQGTRPVLEISGLCARGSHGEVSVSDLDLSVDAGTICAVVGVEGNGQTELEECLIGLRRPFAGTIAVAGTPIDGAHTRQRLQRGMAFVPSDRYRHALFPGMTVAENLVADRVGAREFSTSLRLRHAVIRRHAEALIERFRIDVPGVESPAGMLSGGNAQRLVLARALTREPLVLVAAQPSRGLDVGAIETVWDYLGDHRDAGVAILLITADLDEAMALADQIVVLYRGRKVGEWPRLESDREAIGRRMGGLTGERR